MAHGYCEVAKLAHETDHEPRQARSTTAQHRLLQGKHCLNFTSDKLPWKAEGNVDSGPSGQIYSTLRTIPPTSCGVRSGLGAVCVADDKARLPRTRGIGSNTEPINSMVLEPPLEVDSAMETMKLEDTSQRTLRPARLCDQARADRSYKKPAGA